MEKYIKIFLFMFLLTITVMTTSCGIKNINNSTNKGEIVVENNSNYESITVCGVINGSDILGGMGDMGNMTGGNTQNTTTSSLKKDDTQSDTQSDTPTDTQLPDMSSMSMQLVGTVENCTNTANLSVKSILYFRANLTKIRPIFIFFPKNEIIKGFFYFFLKCKKTESHKNC